MGNSPLITCIKLSPNCTKPRNYRIDTVTIHCTAGQGTAQQILNLPHFVNYDPKNGSSCNYVVGKDGSIGLCVSEDNRSWCSSNSQNDHRAVTIEVSSDSFPPYKVTEQALAALTDLLADICRRNGIKKLVWSGKKEDRVNHLNGCNMTCHRDFAAKACVPTDSEVLTRNGWVKLSDIEIGDEIACADLDNLRITFEEVYDKVEERRQDTYTNNGLTATKDHRMVYCTQSSPGLYRIEQYKYLLKNGNQIYIPLAGYFKADGLPLSNDMIAFYIATQADGHYMYEKKADGTKSYYGLEFHFKKERKINRIKQILDRLHLEYRETAQSNSSYKVRVYNQNGVNIVLDICEKHLSCKKFTWDWIYLSEEQADFFLKEILFWDGCQTAKLYTSRQPENLDIVSAISALNGVGSNLIGCNVSFRESPFCAIGKGEKSTVRNHRPGNKTTVSCVSVKTGIFLIRQNGKTFIVGNCPGDYLYSLEDDIAAAVNKRLEGMTMDVSEAMKIVKEKAMLSDETIQYLYSYRFGDELLLKLAMALKGAYK